MLASLAKALFDSVIGGIVNFANRWRQDSAQVERGGLQAKEQVQDDTIEKLEEYRRIDSDGRSASDALDRLRRKPKAGNDSQ